MFTLTSLSSSSISSLLDFLLLASMSGFTSESLIGTKEWLSPHWILYYTPHIASRSTISAASLSYGERYIALALIFNEYWAIYIHVWYCIMLELDKCSWCSSWTWKYSSDLSMLNTQTTRITVDSLKKAYAVTKKKRIEWILKNLWRNQWCVSLSIMVNLYCFVLDATIELINATVINQVLVHKQHAFLWMICRNQMHSQ